MEPRLSPDAQKVADGRYERASEAWVRAHRAALNELCKADAECSQLKQKNAEASALLSDFADRLPLARAALEAARGPVQSAVAAAKAAIVHPEYPQLKRAQQLTDEAAERCADLPPQAEP